MSVHDSFQAIDEDAGRRKNEVRELHEQLAALRARIRTLEGLLRRCEWVSDGPMVAYCPICENGGEIPEHAVGCELKAALEGGAE